MGKPRPAPAPGAPLGVRILVLTALLLLAAYTVYAAARLRDGESTPQGSGEQRLLARADALVAQADLLGARLQGAATGAAEVVRRSPEAGQEGAETALRLAGGRARAAAVVNEAGLLSTAGQTRGVDWAAALDAAGHAGAPAWTGVARGGASRLLYSVASAETDHGRRHVALVADLAPLLHAGGALPVVLAAPDGRLLASGGEGLRAGARSLSQAFGLESAADAGGGEARVGRLEGRPAQVVAVPALGGGLTVAVGDAADGLGAATLASPRLGWAMLLAPLAVALILSLVLLRQMRLAGSAHHERLEGERRFRLAVEAARCGIWEWRFSDDTVVMSDVTGAMLGWGGPGTVPAEQVIERIAPEHQERVRQALRGGRSHGALDVSFRVPGADGGAGAWIDARGQAFGEPTAAGYASLLGVALDVTAERSTEHRAQLAERRLNDAIESVSEGFVLWDRTGKLVLCNQPYRSFFNLEPRLTKPGAPRKAVLKVAELAVKTWTPPAEGRAREIQLHDGRWLQVSERRTAEGGLVMTTADITAIKEQEQARRLNEEALQAAVTRLQENRKRLEQLAEENAQEKMRAEAASRAKSEFLANMSHELRTPLNAINGFSEMMVSEMFGPLGDPRYRDYSTDILSSGQHLLALINDILDMSKIEAGKLALRFEPVDLQDVVEDAARLMRNRAEAAGLTLSIEADAALPEIEADYRALKQILLNLLSNALKFTPRGGSVTVVACPVLDPRAASRVEVRVRDTGIGIAQGDLARLAKPFEQIETQHAKTTQGTGLGLALTKSLVELHGGVFTIESAPAQGTTVSFVIPVRRARAGGAAEAPSPSVDVIQAA